MYLISTTEVYRVDTEKEADQLIQQNKKARYGELTKYTSTHKETKAKGEIVDDYYRVTLVKSFDSEKDPCNSVLINYYTEEDIEDD